MCVCVCVSIKDQDTQELVAKGSKDQRLGSGAGRRASGEFHPVESWLQTFPSVSAVPSHPPRPADA